MRIPTENPVCYYYADAKRNANEWERDKRDAKRKQLQHKIPNPLP